ncbi:MAG TPA: polyribonucleotide nucleotidyltransferase, partial [Dehalococcoidia bacterium]|nr:polyribonucleotide nucleotidyltransferase [Dehalococcoidia bacterium]
CASDQPREGIDFFPLTIDYEERLYAAGKIPGSFFRREGRPTTEAVLAARLTDRPLRPLFPKGFRNDVQIVVTVLSADQENSPDVLGTIGASTAVCMSSIPFGGPVSAIHVGYIDGEYVIMPTFSQLKDSEIELTVSSTGEAVMMVEAGATGVSEELILGGIRVGHEANQEIIALQNEIIRDVGKEKTPVTPREVGEDVRKEVAKFLEGKLEEIVAGVNREERERALGERREELMERLGETYAAEQLLAAFDERVKQQVRGNILEKGVRPDGRGLKEIRPLSAEVGILPRTHGSGLFTRGQTQALTIATLGSASEEQRLDTLSPEDTKRFLHHYNFPAFSVGEVRRMGSPSRRDIGHGSLAERAIEPVIPGEEEFPYTIRLVTEVLSSNGSTSMASVCGSTLALMDAGVPIKAPVAGIAMGLIKGEDGGYKILTDIAGIEDAMGDMDFKVAGMAGGITALQMDIKVKGITPEIMGEALEQAKEARLEILDKIRETIPESRQELSRYAPRMYRIKIPQAKIGTVIGPGGRVIRSIIEETKCSVDVEDDGTVFIGSTSEEAANRAMEIIQGLTKEVEVGQIYTGKVTRITNFGAFVELTPGGKEGLVRISELADYRVPSVEDVVKLGDEIMVQVIEIDSMGRVNLSRRAVLEGGTEGEPPQPPPVPTERMPVGGPMSGGRSRRPGGYVPEGRSEQRPPRRPSSRPGERQPYGPSEGGTPRPRRRPYGQQGQGRRQEPRQGGPGGPGAGPAPRPPFGRRW